MSDSVVQIGTVGISVAALVFSTTAASWALVYKQRQTRAVAHANAVTEKAQREQARNVSISASPPLQTTLGAERAGTLRLSRDG
ncbi:hypothetical protein [Streptomyces katrae]|uniref:hypothetical protein n=1 Tax=Streptomyces katrae TaxID=68223 RepID=UPI0004C0581D|nr:hypothetical protein [Streptomyces katrae]